MLAEAQTGAPGVPRASLQELHFEIEQLNSEYARILDSERFEEFPELFVEECLYRVVPRENHLLGLPIAVIHCESKGMIKDRIYAARESTMAEPRTLRHFITNIRILDAGDEAVRAESQRAGRADYDQSHDGNRAVGIVSGPHRAKRRSSPIQGAAVHLRFSFAAYLPDRAGIERITRSYPGRWLWRLSRGRNNAPAAFCGRLRGNPRSAPSRQITC